MQVNVYSMLDTKSGIFSQPFVMVNDGMAVRAILEVSRDLNTMVAKYPGDFTLYCLGNFDDNTGVLNASPPRSLGLVSALQTQTNS